MKKLFLVIFAMILSIPAKAQLSIGKSAGQIITENAVSGSVIVIKQSYQVKNKKTGNIYGRDGRKDFGHFYSIGIKAEPGLILTDAAIRPWLFDDAFKKVEQDYEPIVSLTELREVKADGKVNFYQQPLQMERQQPNGLWIANVSEATKRSIEIDKESGVKEGWLVWFVASKNLDSNPEAEIIVQTFNKRLELPLPDEIWREVDEGFSVKLLAKDSKRFELNPSKPDSLTVPKK